MNLIIAIIIIVLSAICKAGADILQHHYDQSIFKGMGNFWTADGSNKYKNGDSTQGRKYPAFLDGFTDAWHIFSNSIFGLLLLLTFFPVTNINFVFVLVGAWTLFIQTFNLFYNHIFKK